jgi:hypothetical protein
MRSLSVTEAPRHFIQFKSLAKTFSQQKLSILRVDNTPKLVKGKLEEHCNTSGITYEKTVPDTPSQNSIAERCNLTLASMSRALLLDTGLSEWFWPFAILTAVHLKNHVPHSNLPPDKTPFKLWHQHKPNLSHLHPFGTPCTSRILSNNLSKFAAHGEASRFLGYVRDAKGYLVWVPNPSGHSGTVKTHWDVVFHDFAFPIPPDKSLPLWDEITVPKNPVSNTVYVPIDTDILPFFNTSLKSFSKRTHNANSTHKNMPCTDINVDAYNSDNPSQYILAVIPAWA